MVGLLYWAGEIFIHKCTILSVGETGLGKSTLMDTLFNTHFDATPSTHFIKEVGVKAHTYGKLGVSKPCMTEPYNDSSDSRFTSKLLGV